MIARVALVAVLGAAVVQASQETFRSGIEAVRVDALVTDHGVPIRGLGVSDFEVFDNGVPQHVDLLSFEQVPLNVILTLDMSDSVAGDRLDHLRDAGRSALNTLEKGDQSALVTFSHAVSVRAPLSDDGTAIRHALDDVEGAGETALVDGVFTGIMIGESDAGRALQIVFSDGVDTASWLTPAAVLDAAKRSDVVVYAVSVRSATKPEFLRDLTQLSGGRLYELEKTTDLASTFKMIVEEFRHPLPGQLHATRRNQGRVAPPRRARESEGGRCKSEARLSRRLVDWGTCLTSRIWMAPPLYCEIRMSSS